MAEFAIRPMTREDTAAVTRLMAAAEAADRTEEHYNLGDVLEDFDNPMIDPASDWVVAELDGRLVGHARLLPRAVADGAISVGIDGTVHPEHRRQGLGSRLVPLLVERAHAYVRERGAGLRPVVTASAPSDNTDLAAILARLGVRPDRWQFVMHADLSGLGASPGRLPDGYTWHTWEGADHDELRRAHNRAFPGHPGFTAWDAEMWAQWVARSRNFRPALSLLARDPDGDVAAYLQTSEFDAVEEVSGVKEAFVAKVGTLERHRRLGLASTLLQEALRRYRDAGFVRAALDVDSENPTGALGLYERVGFVVHRRWTNYLLDPAG